MTHRSVLLASAHHTMDDINHPSLWLDEGNIILRARSDNQQVIRFCVHRFLAHHSPIFRDMFALPAPSDAETLGGLPVVDLQDKAEDVEVFLKALYTPRYGLSSLPCPLFSSDSSSIPFRRMDPNTPIKASGILRLATKYEVLDLRTRIIEHFESD